MGTKNRLITRFEIGTETLLATPQEIGVEMANALSQIKLNESQAYKNEAEANKIKGVDTEAQIGRAHV